MIDYKVAVPSYKRPNTVQKKTLRVLGEHNIPPELVTIFVADQDEYDSYSAALKGHPYGNNIVVGVPTIGAQRNFIEKWYPEGTKVMMFDDDIDEVQRRQDSKNLVPVDDLYTEIIERGFSECDRVGAKTFGIYAAANPYFMKDRVYTKVCYIIASMFGIICDHDPELDRVTNHGEDYEYSMRQYRKHGVLCRLDNYTVKSNYYKEEGGLQTIRTEQYIHDSIVKIAEMFPDLCTMYTRKSTGHAELRLRDTSGGLYDKDRGTLDEFF
jgi:hypothetical protein